MIERRESDCVDCVGVSEFDHGFVYIFACLDAKKMKQKRKILNFLFSGQPCSWGKNMKNTYF